MPVHDWTRVDAGIFHDFHSAWLIEIRNTLNGGLLPPDYYALAEQHAGRSIADVLTLHAGPQPATSPLQGGVAVAEAPPRVRRTLTFPPAKPLRKGQRKTLVVRHVTGHRIVALIEVVSPANKDRARHVTQFARKVAGVLRAGVHVLLVDLFPPGVHDPEGMHGAVAQWLDDKAESYDLPGDEPLTLASYKANARPTAYLEHLAIGGVLPPMPLFLTPERYVNVPLESTYQAAYAGVPQFWRKVLEAPPPSEGNGAPPT